MVWITKAIGGLRRRRNCLTEHFIQVMIWPRFWARFVWTENKVESLLEWENRIRKTMMYVRFTKQKKTVDVENEFWNNWCSWSCSFLKISTVPFKFAKNTCCIKDYVLDTCYSENELKQSSKITLKTNSNHCNKIWDLMKYGRARPSIVTPIVRSPDQPGMAITLELVWNVSSPGSLNWFRNSGVGHRNECFINAALMTVMPQSHYAHSLQAHLLNICVLLNTENFSIITCKEFLQCPAIHYF